MCRCAVLCLRSVYIASGILAPWRQPSLPSLQFKNLPLVEAASVLRFGEEVDFNFGVLVGIWERLKDLGFTEVTHFQGGAPILPFTVSIGAGTGAQFLNDRRDTGVEVKTTEVRCAWRRAGTTPQYDGFASLLNVLRVAHDTLGKPRIGVVTMAYTNLDQSKDPLAEIIQVEGMERRLLDVLVDLNIARRLESGAELRLQVAGGGENRQIVTTGGMKVAEGRDAFEALATDVHDAMQDEFLKLMTEHAKEVWKFDGIA